MPVTNVFKTYEEAKAAAKAPECIIVVEQPSNTLIATVVPDADLIALMERRPDGGLRTTRLTCGPVTVTLDPAADYGVANESTVREFLEIINTQATRSIGDSDSPGLIQLSRLYPDDKAGTVPSRFSIGDVEHMTKEALGHTAGGHNSYIEGRTVRKGLVGKERGKLSDTEWVFAFNVDSDADKDKGGTVTAVASLVVESSPGNRHYWFFLDRALRADEAQEIGKAIRKASGADHDTGNFVQPYRLAGTVNYPDAKKRERGRYVSPTRILEHSGKLYTSEELLEAFKSPPEADTRDDSSHNDSGDFDSRAWVREDSLPFELRRVIVHGVASDNDDRSKKFFGVVASLKKKFWPLDAIVAIFEKYPDGIASKYKGRIREETRRVFDKIEPERDDLPVISIRAGELSKIVAETESALHGAGVPVFERAGVLVHPHKEEFDAGDGRKALVATLNKYSQESMHLEIDKSATFVTWKKSRETGEVEPFKDDPPGNITRLVLGNTRHWKVQRVAGIITTPLLRADGSLVGGAQPHYDAASCMYYLPGVMVPEIAENPNRDEAAAALGLLLELLDEFPFGNAVDRAVALSGILTPLIRASIDVAPLHFFRARTAGSGKSYLVEITSTIATGSLCAVMAVPESEEELEKRLGSLIMKGVSIVSLDNADIDIGGAALCQLTERPRISLRILGKSEMPEYDCRATVFATGNNVGVRGDMVRRTLMCNLDRGVERPELHEFERNPIRMVRENRGIYIAAALTIIRAYILAGAPNVFPPLGSYSQWGRMVRGPLVWLGQPDPVASMEDARRDDPELAAIRQLLTTPGWIDDGRMHRVRDVIEKSKRDSDLAELLDRIAGERGDTVSNKRLGWWLRKISGRVVDGRRLVQHDTKAKTAQYYVERIC